MQLDRLQVELRPRTPWEAMELGIALVRRNARVIWLAWLLASVPVFLICNTIAWAFNVNWVVWLAAGVMWWLKPAFDRVVLFVISRAVFDQPVTVREGAAALWRFGRGSLLHDLTWGRIGFRRALVLPVSLLEGASGQVLRDRRRVLAGQGGESVVWLTILCLHFELVIVLAALALIPLFIPVEFLTEAARAAWALLSEEQPRWLDVGFNLLYWLATTLVEPFYVGAGFGLYLNRRTQLEGWDIEIAFRRMRARLRAAAMPVLLAALCLPLLCGAVVTAHAQGADGGQDERAAQADTDEADAQEESTTLGSRASVFSAQSADPKGFESAVQQAYRDPLLRPVRKQNTWVPKREPKPDPDRPGTPPLGWLGALAGGGVELVLWGLLALAVLWLLWTLPRFWPGLWRPLPRQVQAAAVEESPAPYADALPDDIAAAARRLWTEGRQRAALALLYRASVGAMTARIDAVLPPGATESECLRASRGLRDAEDRSAFAEVVRTWQYAAYAQRLPAAEDFEHLVSRAGQRFGWAT